MKNTFGLEKLFNSLQIKFSLAHPPLLSIVLIALIPLFLICIYLIVGNIFTIQLVILNLIFLTLVLQFLALFWIYKSFQNKLSLATQIINDYFQEGKIISIPQSSRDEFGLLFNAIYNSIETSEQCQVQLETCVMAQDMLDIPTKAQHPDSRLKQCLSISARHNLPLCIALIQVESNPSGDNLQLITDEQITTLTEGIQDLLRESDWVTPWADNEFLVILFAEAEGAKIALNRILKCLVGSDIPQAFTFDSTPFLLKIGFTTVHPNEHFRACFERASQALKIAQYGDKTCVYQE